MTDGRQQASPDGIVARDDAASGRIPTFALRPVEEGKSWALSALVAASVLAAGGALFGMVGCASRPTTGAVSTMRGDYDRTRNAFKPQVAPSNGLDSAADAATQNPPTAPIQGDTPHSQH
jgi:hypothetical protein